MALTPEEQARETIDEALYKAGWDVQDVSRVNVNAAQGVAIREFPLKAGYGTADYLLYVNGKAAGALEAKKEGTTLSGVEIQTEKYSEGMPDSLPAHVRPLPFLYQSTGVETFFTNRLDPEPRSRRLFHFHRPAILAEWLQAEHQAPDKPSTKLVPQDSTDEPASVLLERIRVERGRPTEKPQATPRQTKTPQPAGQPNVTVPVQGELALEFRQ